MSRVGSETLPGEVRRRRTLLLIEERGFMRVADLSKMFDVSEVTTRSDLDQLAEASLLERVHGGAMALSQALITTSTPAEDEPSFEESADTLADEKTAIGRAAASLVSSGDSLIIDVGTTTTAVARALTHRSDLDDVVVFTNGITIAMELESAIPRFTVILTGGTLRPRQHSLVNPMGSGILEEINVDIAFIGCNGIDPTNGVTNINLPEAQIKRRMIGAAHRVVVVADGTKVGGASVARVALVEDVDDLITTESADEELMRQIRELNVAVTVAE
ncbi:MAG: DeoR/GlpR family DNA-binding transcription regulator [Actinomycetota bacterium]|nr:DeoR/GlpR family DNA-binding transcription regulator [Actinomycetota bacterium]